CRPRSTGWALTRRVWKRSPSLLPSPSMLLVVNVASARRPRRLDAHERDELVPRDCARLARDPLVPCDACWALLWQRLSRAARLEAHPLSGERSRTRASRTRADARRPKQVPAPARRTRAFAAGSCRAEFGSSEALHRGAPAAGVGGNGSSGWSEPT